MTWSFRIAVVLAIASPCIDLTAAETKDPSRLTVQRIFGAHEFESDHVSVAGWKAKTATRHSSRQPIRRGAEISFAMIPKPPQPTYSCTPSSSCRPAHGPLGLDDYSFSADRSRLLIFTNAQRVWRTNTRGDYWVLDRTSHELNKLGGDAPPASLMHAKFSPDGSRVAFMSIQ